MDYYEELGLDRTATEDDIRRAHRRMTKLLHPDQQTDEGMKQLAETQMRRLNAIVETLTDPRQRQEYDDGLRRGMAASPDGKFRRGAFHSWPWWVGSTVGAVVLTVAAVWFSADKWGSSFGDRNPTYIPSGAEIGSEPTSTSPLTEAPPSPAPAQTITTPSAGPPLPKAPVSAAVQPAKTPAFPLTYDQTPSRTVASVPTPSVRSNVPPQQSKSTVVVAEVPRRKTLSLPLTRVAAVPASSTVNVPAAPALSTSGPAHVESVSVPAGNLPAAPKLPEPAAPIPGTSVTAAIPKEPPNPHDLLEGEWVYAPTEPERRKAGFYPPEYIDLKFWNDGGLRGEYRARYHVTDKPIPPDVSFALASDGNPRHFTWESSNGSKGTLKISAMDASSIRIEWRTTVFPRGPALTAGTATLVRRTP